jgi:hypothetical protein
MNETSATIMAPPFALLFCDWGNGHYNHKAAWALIAYG